MAKTICNGRVPRYLAYSSIGIGVVVVVLACVLGWVVIPNIIEDKVKDQTRLVNGSDTYEKWTDIPVPIYLTAWFFNVTNFEEFESKGNWSALPHFEQVGPFVWKEVRKKFDIKDGEDDTVFYKQNKTYIFDKALSGNVTEDQELYVVNIPLIAAITLLDVYPVTRILAAPVLRSLHLQGESIFFKAKAVDVLFKGHQLPPVYNTVESVARFLRIPLPDEIKDGEFAAFRGKNDTDDGIWQVHRGVKDSEKFNIIKSVKGKTSLEPWWKDECAMINGTDGTMFPPFIKKEDKIYIYAPEICRSIYLEYDSEMEYEGISGYRFKLPNEIFTSPNDYAPNQCFCMPVASPLDGNCNYNGMMRLASCKDSVPIAISKPHFLDADDWMIAQAIMLGMSPRREDHDAYLDIEPNTGFPLRAHIRLQIGVEMQPYTTFKMAPFDTIPHVIYPLLWIDQGAELDEALVDEIKDKLIKPLSMIKIGKWSLIGVGAFFVVSGGLYVGLTWFRSRSTV